MTSGPGTVPTPGWFSAGSVADFTSPFSSRRVISIGCMAAPIEISPATVPASDGRPSDFGEFLRYHQPAAGDAEQLRLGFVIVLRLLRS